MNDVIDRQFFFDKLVEINEMQLFIEWFFYSGMLFGSLEKWWGCSGKRPSPHEGLDIGFYKDKNNKIKSIKPSFQVPVANDGTIIEISDDDFLGQSVFVRHELTDENQRYLHSVYAHSKPDVELQVNDIVKKGDVIAEVADISGRNLSISAHLHISMIWLTEDYPLELLKWQILPESSDAVMADPFDFFDCKYSTKDYQFK